MALIASEAALRQRCLEITPDGSLFASLAAQSIRTFRQLAFAIGTPRSEPSQEQYQQLATQLFGSAPPLGRVAQLRDLHLRGGRVHRSEFWSLCYLFSSAFIPKTVLFRFMIFMIRFSSFIYFAHNAWIPFVLDAWFCKHT